MKFFATSQLSEHIAETPEGYLICCDVPIARTGEMVYMAGETPIQPDKDGKVIVTRDQAEVFRPETIASFQGKSFTIFHPDGFVSPKNWKMLTCGIIQNVRRGSGSNGTDLMADILITDAEAIKKVKAGVREVSCGYDAEYIETGIGRGVQKNIVGNHVALVDEGRAGGAYAINDHKGKGIAMSFIDKLKKLIESEDKPAPVVVETKDAEPSAYDKMCGMMKDMGVLLESMKPGDAMTAPTQVSPAQPIVAADKEEEEKPKEEPAKDAVEERFKKIEDALAQLMKGKDEKKEGEEEKKSEDESKEEESEDDEPSEGGEVGSEDDLEDVEEMTGDAASRIEILAPGMKLSGKDAKAKALAACYETTDGQKLIHRFTDGKPVDPKNAGQVEMVFVGVSELLKAERKKAFGSSKTFDIHASSLVVAKGSMTAEDINKKNAAHYAAK